ncbi:MAG: GNAT family N-acetyltransferase [Anaerolineae bacterium]|nr:GNAT family N-acetyltransferase [Anaerolineae bacterium]MDW8072153.1 GNAT family N-acetyltransferase [Anaerolineae bacterium]
MDYSIRPATSADVPAIGQVARETWRVTYAQTIAPHNQQRVLERAYTDAALAAALGAPHSWFFVAVDGQQVLGFAQFLRRGDGQGELARIYVLPAYQRQGIGRALLQAGVNAMAREGIHRCYVSVEVDNAPAIAFYQHFGFRYHRVYASFVGDQLVQLLELKTALRALRHALETR